MNAFVLLIAATAAAAGPVDDTSRLVFVTFVHRHGDRSPVGSYPCDPHGNESLWNNGWGELTNAGKLKAHALGRWLRERYADFLPKTYNRNDYEVQSTDVRRTLMSAYLVLAGLYEPAGRDVWHPSINWQPIPVHTIPTKLDNVLAAQKPCPKHTKLTAQLMLSKDIVSRLKPLADKMSEIVKHAGYNSSNIISDFLKAVLVYDSLHVQSLNGLKLPGWSKAYYPQPLQDLNLLLLRIPSFNKPLQRLSCGPLVRDILQHLKWKALGVLREKMWQYSAHDSTIVSLRQCLGFTEMDPPPFGSALIVELRTKGREYHVKLLYKAGDKVQTLVVPGCSESCPLLQFEKLVSPIIPDNWEEECK